MAWYHSIVFALCASLVLAAAAESAEVGGNESCAAGRSRSSRVAGNHVLIQVRQEGHKKVSQSGPCDTEETETEEAETEKVEVEVAACCAACAGRFCSPQSGNCYDTKRKDYYASCPACEGDDCPMGWKTGSDKSGRGQWCEIGRPPADWAGLKTCPTGAESLKLKVLTYNLFWWNLFRQRHGENGRAGRKIASTSGPEEYDVMGFQECDDIHRLLRDAKSHGLSGEYGTINGGRAMAIAYLKSRWTLLASGKVDVGEDSRRQYYGKRAAQWARLQHTDGSIVFFANHHGPLPVSVSGGCAGSATAYNIMRMIAENAHAGDAVVLVGDFNAQPHSSRIRALDAFMHRTFTGTSHHGVDHIFSNCGEATVKGTKNLGSGGSDHDALSAVFEIPSGGAAAELDITTG